MRLRVQWLALTLAATWLSACNPPYYTSEAFDAQIVDAESGRPIEGALVLAWWQLHKASFDAPRTGSVLEAMETVTDKEGRFHIEGFMKLNPGLERLIDKDPGLIVYKPGYLPAPFGSTYTLEQLKQLGAKHKSTLAGQTLRLMRWDRSNRRMADYLSTIGDDLEPIVESCWWTAVPRFMGALVAEANRIRREEPSVVFSGVRIGRLQRNCGVDPKSLSSAEK